jgi:UDPglucose 6-dehydrogenase
VNGQGKEPIAIFGAGWVGLVTGACFAELGHEVTVRDIVPERIERLRAGEVPFFEPRLSELVERNADRLTFTLDAAKAAAAAELVFVCVDTPPTYSGDADLSRVWTVIDELPQLDRRTILVMKSTVPVGTGEKVRAALESRGLSHIGYVSNPEFLAEGGAVEDFLHPDRVVIGSYAEADGDRVARLYDELDTRVVRADVASAEMIKLAANAFLATRISFINEIANVCEVTGADVEKVAEGVGLDHRLGPHFLRAGVGFGGSCFPKDTNALKQLASNSGYHFQLLSAVIEVNELQKRRVINKLQKYLGSLRGKRIALLGLAFKANTDDMREAPSIVLASRERTFGPTTRSRSPATTSCEVFPCAMPSSRRFVMPTRP